MRMSPTLRAVGELASGLTPSECQAAEGPVLGDQLLTSPSATAVIRDECTKTCSMHD